ncbi:hypothetical protein [Nostoc sp.]|uniref:hypothetical protein n=1 Tax=Nostoc sp. TaxID=1180 RepID=UPI002FFBF396
MVSDVIKGDLRTTADYSVDLVSEASPSTEHVFVLELCAVDLERLALEDIHWLNYNRL